MRFIPVEQLERGMIVGRDIIFTTQAAILKRNTELSSKYIDFLLEKGFLGVYVADEVSEEVELEDTLDQKLFQNSVEAVRDGDVETIIDIATDIVGDLLSKSVVCTDILDLRSFDDYTYHHSVNVAVYCVLVGKRLGLKESALKNLCLAGLCHDLGKRQIDPEILNKNGRLTEEEFTIIKNHPVYSMEALNKDKELPSVVKQGVLHHHENLDGSGYPDGQSGKKVSLFARIIHAVDVYDALTSKRPYKEPYEPLDAFAYLDGGRDRMFDSEIVDIIFKVIPAYPLGIDVYLSNGERALVIRHSDDMLRPIVKVYGTNRIVDLSIDEDYEDVEVTSSGIVSRMQEVEKHKISGKNSKNVKKPKILVVDDNRLSLVMTRDALENAYEVETVVSGTDALEYIEKNGKPDLIIMDIEMPVMNGIRTMEIINERYGGDIPVVFQTSVRDRDTIIQCKMMGAAEYIIKPANPVFVKETVYLALNGRLL